MYGDSGPPQWQPEAALFWVSSRCTLLKRSEDLLNTGKLFSGLSAAKYPSG